MTPLLGALDTQAQALTLQNRRLELLARNIANADTPNFKARDIDFRAAMRQARERAQTETLHTTTATHLARSPDESDADTLYRVPFNASFDGNTVELSVEQAQFGKAAAELQSTLSFLENRVSGLKKVLRGE
jgi:flagellar basal-body rod protein FlgB